MRFVVHYAEIGLKGRNRPRFEGALRRNLERTLAPLGSVRVSNLWGRLLVDLPDADLRRARERLRRVYAALGSADQLHFDHFEGGHRWNGQVAFPLFHQVLRS